MQDRILKQFEDSINLKQKLMHGLAPKIEIACQIMYESIESNHKILSCGNGGSAADAQHFTAELINRFEIDRKSLPAISLTTDSSVLTSISNDYSFDEIFSKQILGIGKKNDVLLAISTSGNSNNICSAIKSAKLKEMKVVALTGNNGGKIRKLINNDDIEICISSNNTARIQELHILIIHCLCNGIDFKLFGENNK